MEQFESASILCGIICLPLGLALSPFLDLMRGSILLMYKRAVQEYDLVLQGNDLVCAGNVQYTHALHFLYV